MDSCNIRYAKGPARDGSIYFTRKRIIHKPYTNMNLKDFTLYKVLYDQPGYKPTFKLIKNITIQFYRLRDKESSIGCYDCEQDTFCSDFCHCGPICENCGDKYCNGCGFHREDIY